MTVDAVNEIAQGRVWTGEQAAQNRLVDQLGGFTDALAAAKKAAKLPSDREVALIELPEQPSASWRSCSAGRSRHREHAPVPAAMRSMAPAL